MASQIVRCLALIFGGRHQWWRLVSVTRASGAVISGCASRTDQERLALHSLKAVRNAVVQEMG